MIWPKLSKGEPMRVELHSNRKMFKRQYRLSEPDMVEMNRQIQQMEKSGVIEPWVIGHEKNGQKRMVVDLRGVNSLIIPKLVQLPQIEELWETVTSFKPRYLMTLASSAHSIKKA